MPELPRRCDPSRWVSRMPTASMRAYIVVGPTCANPRALRARARASDSGGDVRQVLRFGGGGGAETPQERGEPADLAEVAGRGGVADRRLDLAAVADDPRVCQEPLHVGLTEIGDRVGIEPRERPAERLALAQDRRPRQPRLERLEAEALEQSALVADRHTPLGVVVVAQHRLLRRPPWSRQPVVADDEISVPLDHGLTSHANAPATDIMPVAGAGRGTGRSRCRGGGPQRTLP